MSEAMRTGVHDLVVLVEQAIAPGTDAKSVNPSFKRFGPLLSRNPFIVSLIWVSWRFVAGIWDTSGPVAHHNEARPVERNCVFTKYC